MSTDSKDGWQAQSARLMGEAQIAAIRSHSPAFNPSRTNPRRSARHTNSKGRWRYPATSPTILFSKPAPAESEKGRLLGSAHTLKGRSSASAERARTVANANSAIAPKRFAPAPRPQVGLTWSPLPSVGQSLHEFAPRSRTPYPCIRCGHSRKRSIYRERDRR